MRLEDMKKEMPATPEFIREMIRDEVGKQMNETKIVAVTAKKTRKKMTARMAAALAACLLLTSTAAYAGVRLYHIYLEKTGKYSVDIKAKALGADERVALPEKIHDVDITANYIPEGMEWTYGEGLHYPNDEMRGGISFEKVIMDDLMYDEIGEETHLKNCEVRMFGSYEGAFLRYDRHSPRTYARRIYLLCPEVYHVIVMHIGDDVSEEDAVRVAENLAVTQNDKVFDRDERIASRKETSAVGKSKEALLETAEDTLPIYQIGDELQYTDIKNRTGVSVRVDSVRIADDLSPLGGTAIPEKWTDLVGADGRLKEGTLYYMRSGDGRNTLNKVVKTEKTNRKLVYVTLTYTNHTDNKIDHLLYQCGLMLLKHENGKYRIDHPANRSGNNYDYIGQNDDAGPGEMDYYTSTDYGNGGNYIKDIKPGESVSVNVGWILNEEDLDEMYISFSNQSGFLRFDSALVENGMVDIRQ